MEASEPSCPVSSPPRRRGIRKKTSPPGTIDLDAQPRSREESRLDSLPEESNHEQDSYGVTLAYELAEGLYQSIRMQLSVKKYKAIRENRGATLDSIDKNLRLDVSIFEAPRRLAEIRSMKSEKDRHDALNKIVD